MALYIGVSDGTKKGFTDRELDFTNGFTLGMLCMITGTGKIEDVNEFRVRLLEANFINPMIRADKLYNFMTIAFIQKMKDAGWSCNVSTKNKRQFNTEIKRLLYSYHEGAFQRWLKYEACEVIVDTMLGGEEE
tara:strand:+ start:745 stop:1143 length:399 start_codon:yes stop_codon:yes gene_type:complete